VEEGKLRAGSEQPCERKYYRSQEKKLGEEEAGSGGKSGSAWIEKRATTGGLTLKVLFGA